MNGCIYIGHHNLHQQSIECFTERKPTRTLLQPALTGIAWAFLVVDRRAHEPYIWPYSIQ